MKRIITALTAVFTTLMLSVGLALPAHALTQDHVGVYNQINQHRASRGLPALAWSTPLNDHSQAQAQTYANGGGLATAPAPSGFSYTVPPKLIAGVSGSGQPTTIYSSKWSTDPTASAAMAAASPANSIGVGVAYGADGKAYVVVQIAGLKAIPKPAPVVVPAPVIEQPAVPAPVVPAPVQPAPVAPVEPVVEEPAPAAPVVPAPAPEPVKETKPAEVKPTPTPMPTATPTPTVSETAAAVPGEPSKPDASAEELEAANLKVLEAERTKADVHKISTGLGYASYGLMGMAGSVLLMALVTAVRIRRLKEVPLDIDYAALEAELA